MDLASDHPDWDGKLILHKKGTLLIHTKDFYPYESLFMANIDPLEKSSSRWYIAPGNFRSIFVLDLKNIFQP